MSTDDIDDGDAVSIKDDDLIVVSDEPSRARVEPAESAAKAGVGSAVRQDDWELPFPARVLPLTTDADWNDLTAEYSRNTQDRPLRRCLEVARELGARSVVVETRYVDPDYRSEYTAFYAKLFTTYADSARRLHFFRRDLTLEDIWRLPDDHGYVGYISVRPQVAGVVGRTVLGIPREFEHAVRTAIDEPVTFFGQRLTIRGVPFLQQDARLGRCAHAASWMCHYMAFRRGFVARRTIGEFCVATDPSLGVGRPLPSGGLTIHQVCELLRSFDLAPMYYSIPKLQGDGDRPPWWPKEQPANERRVTRICCRYLNSGFPVVVIARPEKNVARSTSETHAFVICGYHRREDAKNVDLVVHDDQRGPYLRVSSVSNDADPEAGRFIWEQILAPLPDKLWMSGEAAEREGCARLVRASQVAVRRLNAPQRLLDLFSAGRLSVRTYAIMGSDFKMSARVRFEADEDIVKEYSLARLSRFIWVVEAIDKDCRIAGRPCVVGEVIFDATSDDLNPRVLATRVPGLIAVPHPDDPAFDRETTAMRFKSGGVSVP